MRHPYRRLRQSAISSRIVCGIRNPGTDAEESAEPLIRDLAKQRSQKQAIEALDGNSAAGVGDGGEGGGGLGKTLTAATEPPHIGSAIAGVLGGATPPLSAAIEATTPTPGIAADASTKDMAGRKASTASIGSADSFSVPRDGCCLGFEPALGDISPGKSATVTVSSIDSAPYRGRLRGLVRFIVPLEKLNKTKNTPLSSIHSKQLVLG